VLQSTTNLQTLKELQNIEPSLKYHHNPRQKKYNKKASDKKRKEQKNGNPWTAKSPNIAHPGETIGCQIETPSFEPLPLSHQISLNLATFS